MGTLTKIITIKVNARTDALTSLMRFNCWQVGFRKQSSKTAIDLLSQKNQDLANTEPKRQSDTVN